MPKTRVAETAEILEKEGFIFHFSRMLYINSEKRKIFSIQAIEENPLGYLKEKISEVNKQDGWQFYFIDPLSDEIKRDILSSILGRPNA